MKEKIKNLTDKQLFDVVKNYKTYNYSEDVREYALSILQERGYSLDYLRNNGYLSNVDRENAIMYFLKYKTKSYISLFLYFSFPILNIIAKLLDKDLSVVAIIIFAIFVIEIFTSFSLLNKCYDLIPNRECPINGYAFFTIGIIFYFVVFFYFKNNIEEDINEIK